MRIVVGSSETPGVGALMQVGDVPSPTSLALPVLIGAGIWWVIGRIVHPPWAPYLAMGGAGLGVLHALKKSVSPISPAPPAAVADFEGISPFHADHYHGW